MIFNPPNPKAKNPAILFIHAWRGDQEGNIERAQPLVEKGYICMTFDLRGHGKDKENRDKFSLKDFLGDATQAYDELASLESVDKEDISVVGASMGGYLAILLSQKRKIAHLALRAPADYPNEWFDKSLGKMFEENTNLLSWKEEARENKETYSLETLNYFQGDCLIVESEKDDTIPHQTIVNYLNTITNKEKLSYVVLENAPHHLDDNSNAKFIQILLDWFTLEN